ncbi:MAG: methyltransferase, partial [Vagococcus sp.]
KVRNEAEEKVDYETELDILGTDIDPRMIEIAQRNAEEIGLGEDITFKQMNLSDFTTQKEYGVIVANPPYGDRLGDEAQVQALYKVMGKVYKPLDTWSKYILTSDLTFETHFGSKATKKRKLYIGANAHLDNQEWRNNNDKRTRIFSLFERNFTTTRSSWFS